jgi:hypothetical protein
MTLLALTWTSFKYDDMAAFMVFQQMQLERDEALVIIEPGRRRKPVEICMAHGSHQQAGGACTLYRIPGPRVT